MTLPLAGVGVLVTRPAHQAAGLLQAITTAGGTPLALPLLAIEALPPTVAAVALQADVDAWIFTSPNAVRHAAALYPPVRWPSRLAAAGAGTAAALAALGRDAEVPATADGASGLLQLPWLQTGGLRVLIVGGERPLSRLADGLRQRGVEVRLAAVYRRVPVGHPPATLSAALHAADAAVVSSGETLQQLYAQTPPALRARLLALQLAVPSARVLELAGQMGFRHTPLLPERVGDAGFTEALVQWRRHLTASSPTDRAP